MSSSRSTKNHRQDMTSQAANNANPTHAGSGTNRPSIQDNANSSKPPNNQSVLSICLGNKSGQQQHNMQGNSMNNTPSSQSASCRQQNQNLKQKQSQYEHQTAQVKPTNLAGLTRKSSRKTSQNNQMGQKQQNALISTSSSTGQNNNPSGNIATVTKTPGSAGQPNTSTSQNNNSNFSCLIQKKLTSSNYGHPSENNRPGQIRPPQQQVARSLEKLTSAGSSRNNTNFALSQASESQHHNHNQQMQIQTVSSQHSSNNLKKVIKTSHSAAIGQYRGSQPQQKQKIKAFKRDPNLVVMRHQDALAVDQQQTKGAMISQVSAASSVVSRKTVGGRLSSNFVSVGKGVATQSQSNNHTNADCSSLNEVETSENANEPQSKQLKLPRNSQSMLSSGKIGTSNSQQQKFRASIQTSQNTGLANDQIILNGGGIGQKIGAYRADKLSQKLGKGGAQVTPSHGVGGQKSSSSGYIPQSNFARQGNNTTSENHQSNRRQDLSTSSNNSHTVGQAHLVNSNQQLQSSSQTFQLENSELSSLQEQLNSSSLKQNEKMISGLHKNQKKVSGSGVTSQSQQDQRNLSNDRARSSASAASNAAPEASYCPKINLNSSQEIVMRQSHPQKVPPHQLYGQKQINSSKQSCLLPSHMINANGPSSMQAQSKQGGQSFLPPHSGQNVLLSASFEKINLRGQNQNISMKSSHAGQAQGATTSSISQSSQNTANQHKNLRPHQANMQDYLQAEKMKASNSNQQHQQQVGSKTPLPHTNLKVKKSSLKAANSKTFMTPQRLKKSKEPAQKTMNMHDATSTSVVIVSSTNNYAAATGNAKQNQASKAQQYLRNSIMIKQQQPVTQKINQTGRLNSAKGGSISPRNSQVKQQLVQMTGVNGIASQNISRNIIHNQTTIGSKSFIQQSQSMNNSSNIQANMKNVQGSSCSPLRSSLLPPQTAQSFQNIATKQKQQNTTTPKNLNIINNPQKVNKSTTNQKNNQHSQLELKQKQQQEKLKIDKQTYEDLMTYLVKAENKRMVKGHPTQQHDQLSSGPSNSVLQVIQQKMKHTAASNQNSINSSNKQYKQNQQHLLQNKRGTSSPLTAGVSVSTGNSAKKNKANLVAESQVSVNQKRSSQAFQSQQPVARQGNWQPQMTMNQAAKSNNLVADFPTKATGLGAERYSAETIKQLYPQQKQTQKGRILPSSNQSVKQGSLPLNAVSKSKVAITSFMPTNIHNLQNTAQKSQMLKTTISQNSQSRDASLTSQKSANGQNLPQRPTKSNKTTGIKQVGAIQQNFTTSKQNLNMKQAGALRNPTGSQPQQLFVKGSKQVQSRNAANPFTGINSRSLNQNHTVLTVSLKGSNNQTFLALPQPSQNQTVISNQVRGSSKKGQNMAGLTTIPTKIIKSKSLVRGAPTRTQAGNGKVVMNILKKQVDHEGLVPQEALKNNFMQLNQKDQPIDSNQKSQQQQDSGQPPKRPSNGNRSSRSGVKDLQLKSLNFPIKDRVQSAKSSSTNAHNQSQQNQKVKSSKLNGGAQSHRESQRYFSRPSEEQKQPSPHQNQKTSIQRAIERRSRSKTSAANQSQSSKERPNSRHIIESHSKDSRVSGTLLSNSSNGAKKANQRSNQVKHSHDKKRSKKQSQAAKLVHDAISGKQNSLVVGLLPLDILAGPTIDEFEDGRLVVDQSQNSRTNLIEVVDLKKSDKKARNKKSRRGKDSCDVEAEDALEGMVGGNFNTFGEQPTSDMFLHKRKSLEEDDEGSIGPTKLIERIENQIESELRQGKNSSQAIHPMFEVNEQSNNSMGTHESNSIDILAKPPQNSLIETNHENTQQEILLQTIQSFEKDQVLKDVSQNDKKSHKDHDSVQQNLQNFHYSGSFGIPESSVASPYTDNVKQQFERETIEIDASQLYEDIAIQQVQAQSNTIDERDHRNDQKSKLGKVSEVSGLLVMNTEECKDTVVELKHQTLKEDSTTGTHKKGHFQLINMSFSQENNNSIRQETESNSPLQQSRKHKHPIPTQNKNPHNTLVVNESFQKEIQQTYQEYEDITNNMIDSRGSNSINYHPKLNPSLQQPKNNKLNKLKMVITDQNKNSESSGAVQKVEENRNKQKKSKQNKMQPSKNNLPQITYQKKLIIVDDDSEHHFNQDLNRLANELPESEKQGSQSQFGVSKGAAQLLRQINLSLGRDSSIPVINSQSAHESNQEQSEAVQNKNEYQIDEYLDEKIETNTVVENECDSDFQYMYSGDGPNASKDVQSPSLASEHVKSFETTSLKSPQNSTRIELQTPSNHLQSALQSHQASQNTTNLHQYSCEEETRLILLQSSEPESNRKQGGAFAVCSPRTAAQAAAIYEDGANGGRQAVFQTSSVRHSKQVDDEQNELGIVTKTLLPTFGMIGGLQAQESVDEYDPEGEENQSFQTMLADQEVVEIGCGPGHITSFYGPEKPQYDDMVSIIQGDMGELTEENSVIQISRKKDGPITADIDGAYGDPNVFYQLQAEENSLQLQSHEDNDTGGGSQAHSQSPHSIDHKKMDFNANVSIIEECTDKLLLVNNTNSQQNIVTAGKQQQEQDDEDQFQFVENLNKQYADAMQQRKFQKMMSRPRQNSC